MTYVRQTRLGKRKMIIIFSLVGVFFIVLLMINSMFSEDKEDKIITQNHMLSNKQSEQNVIRSNRSIKAGEMAEGINFEVVAVPTELVPIGAVASMQQLKNKRIINAVAEKEFLLQSDLVESVDWYEEEDRLIEHTFIDEAIPATVDAGSVVDIKLFRPKNVDDVVVAKTVVISKVDNTLSFYLNKLEQEYIKEANTEGLIFIVQYLDKSQLPSVVTYMPVYDEENLDSRIDSRQRFADSDMKKE
jgi:hypothetical protein